MQHGAGHRHQRQRDRRRRALRRRSRRPRASTRRSAAAAACRLRSAASARRGRRDPAGRRNRHRRLAHRRPTGTDFALTRHRPSGNLDQSFGTDGIATTDLGGDDDQAFDAALLPDGGIVAVGRTDAAGFLKHRLRGRALHRRRHARTRASATAGIVTTAFAGDGDQAERRRRPADGKIVVAGFALSAPASTTTSRSPATTPTARSTRASAPTGSSPPTSARARRAPARSAIQPDGKIVVAGDRRRGHRARALPAQRHARRHLRQRRHDGHRPRLRTTPTASPLTPGGQILIAGSTVGATRQPRLPARRLHAPTARSTSAFGHFGVRHHRRRGGDDFAENLLVDAQGRIVLVGRATSATILDMALVRYNPDGTLDASFDGDGLLTSIFTARRVRPGRRARRRRRIVAPVHRQRRRHRVRAHARQSVIR